MTAGIFRMRQRGLWLALMLLLATGTARAETYRMDLILFANRTAVTEAPRAGALPDYAGAMALDNLAALQAAGIRLLPESDFALQSQWARLRNSRQFQPLLHLSWTQNDPPEARGPALRLRWGETQPGSGLPLVDGRVMLLIVNRYLTLDADLAYNGSNGAWRLDERRKMRRDELHHLDSARLGILAQVTKVGVP
ncbi:Peptidoglycan-binding protein, CsiV [Solimonas aquatica]|uniref:Peptidoglycan-binding protein, CsiV n=2 Tax=Solimonas aquatica TaxID=489703 RepID=A0A1H9HDY8_9GAMM|nr:Peptidoglycan-binding protein, CsiV [Solimonas aquatica]